jgi:hypothetical protein
MTPELILIVTATYVGSVGYGDVYQCRIEQVLAGAFADASIRISVLAADKERSSLFAANPPPGQLEIGFAMRQRNEPYRMVPISGFVDQNMTSWEIVYLKKRE